MVTSVSTVCAEGTRGDVWSACGGARLRPMTPRRRSRRSLSVLAAAIALVVTAGAAPAFAGATWPVYNGNAQRTGNDTSEPALLPIAPGVVAQSRRRRLRAAARVRRPRLRRDRERHGVRARRARRRDLVVAPSRDADDQRCRAVGLRQRRPARHLVDAGHRHRDRTRSTSSRPFRTRSTTSTTNSSDSTPSPVRRRSP